MRIDRMSRSAALVLAIVVAAIVPLARDVGAQTKYSIWDAGKRTQLSVNVGGLFFFEEETGAETSKGVAGGMALTYSLHERLSLYGLYDHGFPIDASGRHVDILNAAANLTVYPPTVGASNTRLFLGGGVVVFDPGDDVTEWRGYEGHITIARVFRDGWSLSGKYQHGIPFDDADERVNMAKIWLGHRLVGAK